MDFRRPINAGALLILAAIPTACASGTPVTIGNALSACNRGARYVEIRDTGVVRRVVGLRRSYRGMHEGFIIAVRSAGTYKVEDNVDITGPIPLRNGDVVTLQGQFECNDGVIHWTHRDPSGRHEAGFISVHGVTYR